MFILPLYAYKASSYPQVLCHIGLAGSSPRFQGLTHKVAGDSSGKSDSAATLSPIFRTLDTLPIFPKRRFVALEKRESLTAHRGIKTLI